MEAALQQFSSGAPFGTYTIEGLISSGGMGRVYAARDGVYGSGVAIKVLHETLHADPSWRLRFNEEGLVGTRLKHPHILSARELVEHDGRIGLVLDLVPGGQTLDRVAGREFPQGLPLISGLKVFLGIVQGIEYLHDKGIVHGDIKPENVMVVGDYRKPETWAPKVTDFGTVALIAHPVTIDGQPAVVATPRYASPEHLLGLDQLEKRSDIYALGLLLHYLLTGQHASGARSVEEAYYQVRKPVALVALVDQPDPVLQLVRTACDLDPDARFGSCRELALAVRGVLDALGAVLDLGDLQADLATEVDDSRTPAPAPSPDDPPSEATELQVEADPPREPLSARPPAPTDPASDVPTDTGSEEGPFLRDQEPGVPALALLPHPVADDDEERERTSVGDPVPPGARTDEVDGPRTSPPARRPEGGPLPEVDRRGVPGWVMAAVVVSVLIFAAVVVTNFP